MSNSAVAISNLLYRYAEKMDGGDLEGAAALFRHAHIRIHGSKDLLDAQGGEFHAHLDTHSTNTWTANSH